MQNIPQVQTEEDQDLPENSSGSSPKTPQRRRGLGKGSPGCARKTIVTKRQQKNRERPAFQERKRKATEAAAEKRTTKKRATPQSAPQSPASLSSVASEVPSSSVQVPAPSTVERVEESSSSDESLTHLPTEHDSTEKATEEREPLRMQIIHQEPLKSVSLIQTLAKARKDRQPLSRELDLFWVQMDTWEKLDDSMVSALQQLQAHCFVDECLSPDFINLMVRAHNTCNGVTNCIHHILGSMVKNAVDKLRMDSTTKAIEEITNRIEAFKYQQYTDALKSCGCESCAAVTDFDEEYTRYLSLVYIKSFVMHVL